jgi:hypothetical protein
MRGGPVRRDQLLGNHNPWSYKAETPATHPWQGIKQKPRGLDYTGLRRKPTTLVVA